MVARNRTVQGLSKYCLSATLLTTAALSSPAFAGYYEPCCDAWNFFPVVDCAVDRSAPAMHGPFQFIIDYSDKTGYSFDPKYINDLGPSDALSLEFQFGAKLFRASSTWGHALTDNLFFKFTGEYFAESPSFDFLSGEQETWIGQWDLGADMRYRFYGLRGLDSVHFGIQYIKAHSKSLPDVLFNGGTLTNVRHIEGGEELGASLGFRIQPWSSGYIDLDLYYDQNNYDNEFNPDDSAIGFGGGIAYHQNIGERFQFVLSASDRRPYYEYLIGIKWIASHSSGSLLELGAHFYEDGGDVPYGRESVIGVGLYYSWGGDMYAPPVIYADPLHRGLRQELVDYTNDPAVRPPQILVNLDQTAFP